MIIHKIPRQLRGNEYRQKKENLASQSSSYSTDQTSDNSDKSYKKL